MLNKKTVEFSEYAKNLYGNSLVNGIPEIVIASNWKIRLIRLMIFICCIVGFIYQSLDFMDLYWKYPTILDIQITRKGEIMMPAITACDANGVRLSLYCKYFPCKKPQSELRFCRCYPEGRYCSKKRVYPGIMIPTKLGDISKTFFLPQKEREHMMPHTNDFITSCSVNRPPSTVFESCGNVTLAPACPNKVLEPSACFSINSVYGHPERNPPNISVSTAIQLDLFSPPQEYDPDMKVMFKQISLHSPYSLSNPFIEGLILYSERSYKIYVKQTVKHLMKPPYDTKCFDYLKEWKKNGGKGPMSESDCIQDCKKKVQLSQPGGCVKTSVWYPSNDKRCSAKSKICADFGISQAEECDNDSLWNGTDSVKEDRTCEMKCRPACWQITYELTREEAPQVEARQDEVVQKETGMTYITISFQKMEETLYSYKPKYEVVETFSYIGGYVGIWLGVSLLALFDFLETTIIVVKYPFRKKKLMRMTKRA